MSKVLHRKNFQNRFNRSPQEFHAAHAFPPGAKCAACQAKPSIRAIVMIPLDEAEKRGVIPPGAAKAPLLFPVLVPLLVHIKEASGPKYYLRSSMAYSCRACRPSFERTLAKAPSWAIVEINEGPDYHNRVTVGAG